MKTYSVIASRISLCPCHLSSVPAPAASMRVRVRMARMTMGTNCPIISVVFICSQQWYSPAHQHVM